MHTITDFNTFNEWIKNKEIVVIEFISSPTEKPLPKKRGRPRGATPTKADVSSSPSKNSKAQSPARPSPVTRQSRASSAVGVALTVGKRTSPRKRAH